MLLGRPPRALMIPVEKRTPYLYLERGALHRGENSVYFRVGGTDYDIPAATLACVFLGHGTSITQPAALELGRWAVPVLFTGTHGYTVAQAWVPSIASRAHLLRRQATVYANARLRAKAVRNMFSIRWHENIPEKYAIADLMRSEGRKVKKRYKELADQNDIVFTRSHDYEVSDNVNKAISEGSHCLYGLATSVILSLGLTPGLGFLHTGKSASFAYDIADLYKDEFVLPVAFQGVEDIRKHLIMSSAATRLVPRMVQDILQILGETDDQAGLWDGHSVVENDGQTIIA